MPVKRRIAKARHTFEMWRGTLFCGEDWFGELPVELHSHLDINGRSGTPRIDAAAEAWGQHGAQLLRDAVAAPGSMGNGSAWGLWAFGPPPNVDPETLAASLEQMRADWDDIPDWSDREQAENWRCHHRMRLAREAATTGDVPEWVAGYFPDLPSYGPPA